MSADKPQAPKPKAKPAHPWRGFNPGWLQSNPALPEGQGELFVERAAA